MSSRVVVQLAAPLALIAVVVGLAAPPAVACGGLFCSSVQSTPVDQTQERILFEVHADGSVTSTVEVVYTGDPREFSWIIPVTEAPTSLGVVSPSTLRLLDLATAPTFTPPTITCSTTNAGGGIGIGFGACQKPPSAQAGDPPPVVVGGARDDGVDVVQLANVGPYDDIVVIDSDDPDALVAWLNDNEYLVTEPMMPLIAQYAAEGQKFMAMKLRPDAGTQDIVPVRFTCPPEDGATGAPHIPIRLTGIAAVPEMSIVVFVAGPARFAPLNYRAIEIPTDDVRLDPGTGQLNYYALVSSRLDDEGGAAFVVERAQGSEAVGLLVDAAFLGTADDATAREEIDAVLAQHAFVTRLYTRLNPEEMNEDPVFQQVGGRALLGAHDMAGRTVDVCAPGPIRVCGDVYCGLGAACAETETGGAGCLCDEGQVARRVQIAGKDQVTCQARGTDFLGDILLGDASPCASFSCGEAGQCVAVNGAPTCACAANAAAVPDGSSGNGVLCVEAFDRFTPAELLWPAREVDDESETRFARDPGCGAVVSAAAEPASSVASIGAFLLTVVGFARVLRRPR